MRAEERFDLAQRVYEVSRELGVRRVPDDDQQGRLVLDDGGKLIGFVPNARVVRERNPAACGHLTQPHVIRAVVSEVIAVPLCREARIAQDTGKL